MDIGGDPGSGLSWKAMRISKVANFEGEMGKGRSLRYNCLLQVKFHAALSIKKNTFFQGRESKKMK